MGTIILAWLIAILGLLMIAGGVWDVVDLWNQITDSNSTEKLGNSDWNDFVAALACSVLPRPYAYCAF